MLADWERYYPNCDPVGHFLRAAFPDRWVRFHSLPESKRYPEDEREYAEVLTRHNRVLGALARSGEAVILLTTGYSGSPEPIRSYPELEDLDSDATLWRSILMYTADENFGEPSYWHVFASGRMWQPGEFDSLVRLISHDSVANVCIVAEDCRWLLHPYDGGMDVIVESTTARDHLRAEFSSWLSAHPEGL